ncbi:hypothetical protein IV87_GL001799 [Pediococcus ethanolidurans]|nr:hypothetical protein IV87_GL001799 [Pediococcus ethanolidurans]
MKTFGVIVKVDGNDAEVGMYDMSNDSDFIWNGQILSGPMVGAYMTIKQNDVKIIATVTREQVMDQQNTIKSTEFDNRYSKDSINRIISLRTKGVIDRNGFHVTSKYVPMIGNEVQITSIEDIDLIYGVDKDEHTITIGITLNEGRPVKLPINKFFASHIGIFGNTGSGKSNTLHKLYLELFRSNYCEGILSHSQFFVIDFNSEYTGQNIFGQKVPKKYFELSTREAKRNPDNSRDVENKIPVSSSYLFDADILSILFDARPATQVPFLRKSIQKFNEVRKKSADYMARFFVGIIARIVTTPTSSDTTGLQDWVNTCKKVCPDSDYSSLEQLELNTSTGAFYIGPKFFNESGKLSEENRHFLKLDKITADLQEYWNSISKNPMEQLESFLKFQLVYATAWDHKKETYIGPLFERIDAELMGLKKVIYLTDADPKDFFSTMNVVSLLNTNQAVKRVIPMLLSKMIYDRQKNMVRNEKIEHTTHLIIDEAHNILNGAAVDVGDNWRDYRLSVFEEIIKEGRKFGFYLTLASQRPSDISPTILFQIHNYFIHRLVNERDLNAISTAIPSIDIANFKKIPLLGKGETIISGIATQVPELAQITYEPKNRPNSDDVILTDLWNNGGD